MKYHDCRKTPQQMTDWLCAETSPTMPAELVDCRVCLDQYLALKDALGVFDQAAVAMQPAEEYWPGYEAKLRVKLAAEAAPPRWQQWFQRPLWLLPVAAVLLALFFSLAWSRGRSSAVQPQPTPEIPVAAKPDLRQEKEGDWPRPQPRTKRKLDKQAKPERKEPARAPDKKPSLLFDPNPMMASLTAENPATIQHVERAQRLLRSFRNSSPVNEIGRAHV